MNRTLKRILAAALVTLPAHQIHATAQFVQFDQKQIANGIKWGQYQALMQTLTNNINDNNIIAIFKTQPQANQVLKIQLQDMSQAAVPQQLYQLPNELEDILDKLQSISSKRPNTSALRDAIIKAAESKDQLVKAFMVYALANATDYAIIDDVPSDVNEFNDDNTYDDETIMDLAQHILEAYTHQTTVNPYNPAIRRQMRPVTPENKNVILFTKPQLEAQITKQYFRAMIANSAKGSPILV